MSVGAANLVSEELVDAEVPLWRHPDWARRFPWLVQGTTGGGEGVDPLDFGLFGEQPVGTALTHWRRLRQATQMPVALHARQVHGARLFVHEDSIPEGLVVAEAGDGHLTRRNGLLLTVSVADCVPVSLVDPERRALALVHAGWRGVAEGILERAVATLTERFGASPGALWMHCGPAICGRCYEVGPEVHRAVYTDQEPPTEPTPIDLRSALAARAEALGVAAERVSISAHCTRCGPGAFFSHRAGSPARQLGVLGSRM